MLISLYRSHLLVFIIDAKWVYCAVRTESIYKLFLSAFAKLRKKKGLLASSYLPVRPHGTTRLPLDGFSLNLIFEYFPKICRENSNLINPLTPNDYYSGRTAPLTSKSCILYIYSTNKGTEYLKHGIYCPFFSLQDAVCFIILTYLVPVLFTFYIQGVITCKKIIPAPKG